ncbi:uncharacterized protein EHS24_002193 [Apiotrichum porosum]|uniref:BRCT domain-containing protein n=1 Tax=Apiotrichum porosum TaxID=105984 RepID=A0A427XHZ2_9TREE|nr:uncharacterized protein EHS24_002193 [Apiotrichum porosum]RSH78468.1 hypothetical protein EHS24_002193 [Apiotrichum porosum]
MASTPLLSQFTIYYPQQSSTFKWITKLITAAGGNIAISPTDGKINVILFALPIVDDGAATSTVLHYEYTKLIARFSGREDTHMLSVEWIHFAMAEHLQEHPRESMEPFTMDDTRILLVLRHTHPHKKRRLPLDTPDTSRAATKIVTHGHLPTAAAPNHLSRSAGDIKTTRTAPHKRPNIPQALAIVQNTWSSKQEQHQKKQDGVLRQSLAAKAHLGELPKLPKLPPRHRNLFVTTRDGTFARVVPSSSAPPTSSQTDNHTGPSHGRPPTMSSSSPTGSTATTTMAATVTPNGRASQDWRNALLGNWRPKPKADKPIALEKWILNQKQSLNLSG